jgi:ATP-binding cassette subfamily F protein 3
MLERLRTMKREQDEEVARIEMFINRFRYQATKAAQVQSRIKLLEKVVPIEVPPERKRIHFTFPTCAKSGRTVLELKHVRKAYGSLVVFKDLNLHIERGDRIALVGPNGAGKSTLMRMLSGEETPDAGTLTVGHQVVKEYFAQDEATRMEPTRTVYDTLEQGSALGMVPAIRNILGGFLFSGDDVYKKVGVLSGGERTRLAVARMLLRSSNTLLLDEPTNHLDLDSKDVLLEAIEDYGGTLILVSHDRYFVEKLATKIIEIGHGDGIVYPGTYSEFLWSKEHAGQTPGPKSQTSSAKAQAPNPKSQAPSPKSQAPGPKSQGGESQGCCAESHRLAAGHRKPGPEAGSRQGGQAARPHPRPAETGGRGPQEKAASRRYVEQADRGAGEPDCGPGSTGQGARSGDRCPRVLRQPRRGEGCHQPASGADVGGRGPHGAVGSPPGTRG